MTREVIDGLTSKADEFGTEAYRHAGLGRLVYLRLAQIYLHLAKAHAAMNANQADRGDGRSARWQSSGPFAR